MVQTTYDVVFLCFFAAHSIDGYFTNMIGIMYMQKNFFRNVGI